RGGRWTMVAVVVNLTGRPRASTLEMGLRGQPVPHLDFRPLVRSLRDESAGATLDDIAAGRDARCVLAWIPLMQGGGGAAILEQWKSLAAQEPDHHLRSSFAALALVFAELTGRKSLWSTALEKWNMRESQVVKEWKAEGRTEGLKEGRVQTKQEDLLRLL